MSNGEIPREGRLSSHGQAVRVAVGAGLGSLGGLAIETPITNILLYFIPTPGPIIDDVTIVLRLLVTIGIAYVSGYAGYAARDVGHTVGKVLMLFLALGALGCSTVPTTSEGVVNAEGVTAKGGTISCESGFTAKMDPTGEWLASLGCKGKLAWTDPPSPAEVSTVGSAFEALMAPFNKLADAVSRLVPGGAPASTTAQLPTTITVVTPPPTQP